MCYAIPGKVIAITENKVAVEYFGEKKQARNEFFELKAGDYVYAQGGFIIQKISEEEALSVLDTWKELFVKLKELDHELAGRPQDLFQRANNIRQKRHGNACCVHGIIEFSNYCRCDCLYCGIRKSNTAIERYRMSEDEIVAMADEAVNKYKFKALVLQSGEDEWYDAGKLTRIVEDIRKRAPCLVILSIGERDIGVYRSLYSAGARSVLLRFETANELLYRKMRPGRKLEERTGLIKELKEMGFLVMSGFLIGLPGESQKDIENGLELNASLGAEVFSFGPFIPHPGIPLKDTPLVSTQRVLEIIAKARIDNPDANILVNTSFETLDRKNALRLGLMAGANSLMINLTPQKYRRLYDIYPERAGLESQAQERIKEVVELLQSIGRAPVDLGLV